MSLGVLLSDPEIKALRSDLDKFALLHPMGDYGLLYNNLWREVRSFKALVTSQEIVDALCSLLEVSKVVLFQDNLVWKGPGSGQIEWHQDYSYQPLGAANGVTLWVSLDEATPENGGLHYLPGTHRGGERQPANFTANSHQPPLEGLPPLTWKAREEEVVFVGARPGEVLAHHPLVWHMTPENRTNTQRRAYTSNWLTPGVVWDPAHAPHPFNYYLKVIKGEPVEGEQFPCFSRSGGDLTEPTPGETS